MTLLPDRGLRATASRFDVFHYSSSEDGAWYFQEWRMKAAGLSSGADLEGWYSAPDKLEPVIGRVRIKRHAGGGLDDLAPISGDVTPSGGVTEILNLELEPAFVGQELGKTLLRVALDAVAVDCIVVCEPTPTAFSNFTSEESGAKVDSFYRRLGFAADERLPGYLIATRGHLAL